MGVIIDVLVSTDALLEDYVEAVVNLAGPALKTTFSAIAGLSLCLVAANHIYQARQITYSTYFAWLFRLLCIIAFVTVADNYNMLKTLIVDIPIKYSTVLIPTRDHDVYTEVTEKNGDMCGWEGTLWLGLTKHRAKTCTFMKKTGTAPGSIVEAGKTVWDLADALVIRVFDVSKGLFDKVGFKPSTYKYAFSGIIVAVVGGFLCLSMLFVLLSANIGLAMMLAMGPLAIMFLTFQQTRGYFENWLRLTVGFAVVPMMVTAVLSIVIYAADGANVDSINKSDVWAGNLNFILVAMATIPFMFQVPQLASSLASVSLPQMGGASIAHGARSMMAMASNTIAPVDNARERMRAGGMALSRAMNLRDGGVAGKQANPVRAAAKAMMQSAGYRQHRMGVKSQENYRQSEARQHKEAYRQWQAGGRQGPAPQWQNRKTDRFGGRYNRGGAAVSGGDAGGGSIGGGGFGSGNQVPIGTDLDYTNPNHNR